MIPTVTTSLWSPTTEGSNPRVQRELQWLILAGMSVRASFQPSSPACVVFERHFNHQALLLLGSCSCPQALKTTPLLSSPTRGGAGGWGGCLATAWHLVHWLLIPLHFLHFNFCEVPAAPRQIDIGGRTHLRHTLRALHRGTLRVCQQLNRVAAHCASHVV